MVAPAVVVIMVNINVVSDTRSAGIAIKLRECWLIGQQQPCYLASSPKGRVLQTPAVASSASYQWHISDWSSERSTQAVRSRVLQLPAAAYQRASGEWASSCSPANEIVELGNEEISVVPFELLRQIGNPSNTNTNTTDINTTTTA
jgi:hypothetical protein